MRQTRRGWWLGLALLSFGLWPAVALAVPAQLNVQGVLFDETGAPVEGAAAVTVRLYDAADAPTPLWEPALALDVLCEAGVFTALVPAAAEGPEAEAFAAAFDAGEPRWIGITPAGGAELTPRIPVVSVAYALVAGKAALADVAQAAEVAHGVDCVGCVGVDALDPAVQTAFLAYDNGDSGLSATTYQAAVDELAGLVDVLRTDLAALGAGVDGLAAVARSGAYGDLSGTPTLAPVATSGSYGDLTGTPTLAAVATSGAYGDLSGTPDLSGYAQTSGLAAVATTGAYGDLTGTPTLAAVATSGQFSALLGIPAGLADGDADTLGALACLSDEVAQFDGSAWQCIGACDATSACPAVLDLQSRLDVAEADLAAAADGLAQAEDRLAESEARLYCLDQCSPAQFTDCRARTCDGDAQTCTETGAALPDGSPCAGGGQCASGLCQGVFCGGVSCPHLRDYQVACNPQDHCEYTYSDPSGWRFWDIWIWVPAGHFLMGGPSAEGGGSAERPVHLVGVGTGYFVMKYEIVVEQYQACRDDGFCKAPATTNWDGDGWGTNTAPTRMSHPQNGLTWNLARNFCAWVAPGGRLPSEAEWEYAASGPAHRKYPWGDSPEPTCARAVFDENGAGTRPWGCDPCGTLGCSGTQPVKIPREPDGTLVPARPDGASFVGAMDMAGNVWEWCLDYYQADYDLNNDNDVLDDPPLDAPLDGSAWLDPPAEIRVLRGGAFAYGSETLRTARRSNDPPGYHDADNGARCVRPLPQ